MEGEIDRYLKTVNEALIGRLWLMLDVQSRKKSECRKFFSLMLLPWILPFME